MLDTSQQCFSESATRRPADLLSSFTTIKTVMNNLYDGLAEVLMSLLKNTVIRENVLEYLAAVINKNSSRAHLQVSFQSRSHYRALKCEQTRKVCICWLCGGYFICTYTFFLCFVRIVDLFFGFCVFLLCPHSKLSCLQVDPLSCASSGMFVNLSAVMLRLCEPFLDANLTKRDKIDPQYVFSSTRLELR